uniref:carnosine N-methyltransferase n=1 Tax=Polytomella parva TaxID=51329 RepID=A0A7S0UUK8_9CHLO|mmetsp:Transcript_18462/g.33574  ORF Transcript_18462/g.33574 Transcript_18462/m.33574 type:complete len:448 (+) Transcript_18462:834-2177(+)|eukprot:CAMPEP_0175043544 /NCGR_PEP_ID=MMETSP0052_2-20121109/3252_1 /TAXON_ID=51329 ORGANISM="Polytomella parva, Strain SAG 63-3" /NCGR_SAMPLE_ID=MMETSP0052_2 /ASSEMBLY_ACC=CAM_ASM_000194 /LENGTH=447 /DNA_ID=CAMNT_0016306627 /DNA_START=769 /DNA_END=2112 /DNA_ORIENTATION=-
MSNFEDNDAAEERQALARIVQAYRQYSKSALQGIERWKYNYQQLGSTYKLLLPKYQRKCTLAELAVQKNQEFLNSIVEAYDDDDEYDESQGERGITQINDSIEVFPADNEKIRYVLKNFVRDWSVEGKAERDACYGPILAEIREIFSIPSPTLSTTSAKTTEPQVSNSSNPKTDEFFEKNSEAPSVNVNRDSSPCSETDSSSVAPFPLSPCPPPPPPPSLPPSLRGPGVYTRGRILVPGCGLARLCVELAAMNFQAQGNEFSYFMLLGSSFILNSMERRNQFHIYPWVLETCNHRSDADHLRSISLPDVLPSDLVPGPGYLSMCAGDFVEVYRAPDMQGQFDCVITCFFIDTAHNIIEYLEVIRGVLKPGGRWINFGPLLYHWADSHTYLPKMELSIELSLEDVKDAARKLGFRFLKESTHDAPYVANPKSMFKTVYQAEFWSAIRD